MGTHFAYDTTWKRQDKTATNARWATAASFTLNTMDSLVTTMPDTTLIIGGCRSGKSGHALDLGEKSAGRRNLFVATGQAGDPEMEKRIRRHQEERGDRWQTVEEPVDIVGVLEQQGPGADIVIIDCLTLWTSNLMMAFDTDEAIVKQMDRLTSRITEPPCPIILVSNEVGLGIVPENPLARRFRDLTGWCNQRVSKACNRVVWTVAGIPVTIKPSSGAPC